MLLEALDDTESSDSSIGSSSSMAAAPSSLSAKPKLFSQGQLNDVVRDLGLFKELQYARLSFKIGSSRVQAINGDCL